MKNKCILLFLLLGMCLLLHAQNRYGRFVSYQLTINEGLPSNSITDIAQDDDGFVWIGTANGLCRYDGYSMLIYRSMSTNQDENTDNHVAYLDFDAKRKLLKVITTEKTWSYYSTQMGRFVKYDSKWHKTIEPFNRYSMKFEGKLIANTAGCGIVGNYKYVTDKDGNIYFYPKVGKPFKFHLIENSHVVTTRWNKFRVANDKKGNLYIASYGEGLFIYHPQSGQMEHLTVQNSNGILISDFLTAVMVDSQGMVWVGNDDAGITCISTAQESLNEYLYLEPNNRFGWNNYVRCLAKRKDGSFFIGSSVGGGYVWNPGQAFIQKTSNFPSTVTSYVEAHDGSVWVGTRGAGFYVDGVRYSTKDREHYCPCDLIHYMVEDAKGRMWIATYEGGLLLAERTPQGILRIKQLLTRSLDESRIHELLIDNQGFLWVASKHGIYKADTKQNTITNDSFDNFCKKNSSLPGDEIPVLYQAKDGTFWAGIVGQGLVHLKFDKDELEILAQLNASTGIRMNAVYSIVEDLARNIWVGTEQGLVQIDTKQLTVKSYNLAPTFMGNVFTERCATLLPDGSLAFGTKDGLLVMKGMKGLEQRQENRRIVFSDLLVNGASIYNSSALGEDEFSLTKASKVELKSSQNSLTICYSDLDYSPSTLSLFQYYLEGHDRSWRPATTEKKAIYDELEPGHYVFHVRQASGNTGQANNEYTLEIVIRQPWYNTWWAWMIYLLVIAVSGGYVFHSLRERALLNRKIKIEEELMDFKLRFFTNITHEFRTPLAIIQTAVDKMKGNPGQAASRNSLATAQRGVQRMLRLVNQLMEFRKMNAGAMSLHVSKGDIIQFVRQIYQDIWQIASQKGIHMTIIPFEQHHEMWFDERAVEMVVYNLLSNAMKYTPSGGSVILTIQQDADTLVISVADTGKGISKEQEARLFQPFMQGVVSQGGMGIGLYMAHAMAELHHGSLTYHRQEKGSLFVAQIPMAEEAYTEAEKDGKDWAIQAVPKKDAPENIVMENLPDSINDCKIAIVEDDFDMMSQMKEEMGKYFKLETFVDGESAVKDMSAEVALVLCDVMLPGMDGYEVVRRIKEKHHHLPAIMLTALNDDRHQIKGYQAGADDYMLKPCNFKVLLARIVQLIEWSRQAWATEDLAKVQAETGVANAADAAELPQEETPPQLLTSLQDKRFLQKLASTVASHVMDSNFSVDDLAAALHMGRSKFYGKVKELTGQSPSKYILKYRMEEAARLLEADEMTIAEISYQVGIQEPSYFYRCFKSYFGVSPSEYKKNGGMKK